MLIVDTVTRQVWSPDGLVQRRRTVLYHVEAPPPFAAPADAASEPRGALAGKTERVIRMLRALRRWQTQEGADTNLADATLDVVRGLAGQAGYDVCEGPEAIPQADGAAA